MRIANRLCVIVSLCFFMGCGNEKHHEEEDHHEAATNRIQLTNEAINNLGIAFETAEIGKLGNWIQIPGKLEIPREYKFTLKSPCKGRIFWKKERLGWMKDDEVIAVIETSALSDMQQMMEQALQEREFAKRFVGEGNDLRLVHAEREYRKHLGALSVLTGYTAAQLEARNCEGEDCLWRGLGKLEVRAKGEGILSDLQVANGELIEEGEELGKVVNTDKLVFRALVAPEIFSALDKNTTIRVNLPNGNQLTTCIKTQLPICDEESSRVWIEAELCNKDYTLVDGTRTLSYILLKDSQMEETIISESSVVYDQLEAIIFRRDPMNADYVIRTPVELGNRSGGRVEILSGLMEGEEVVSEGVHLLTQISTKSPDKPGHFHADGTFHEGEH